MFRKDSDCLVSSEYLPKRPTKGLYTLIVLTTSLIILAIKAKIWLKRRNSGSVQTHQDWNQTARSILSYKATFAFTLLFLVLYAMMEMMTDIPKRTKNYLAMSNFFANTYPFTIISSKKMLKERLQRWLETATFNLIDNVKKSARDLKRSICHRSPQIQPIV